MGSYVYGLYVPTPGETGWASELEGNFTRLGEIQRNPMSAEFGAVGDGVAADDGPIQDALDAAGAAEDVRLPAGTFRITNTLTMSYQKLLGTGRSTLLVNDVSSGPMISLEGGAEAEIGHLKLLSGTSTTAEGILVRNMGNCHLHHIAIDGLSRAGFPIGILLDASGASIGAERTRMDHIHIVACSGDGIRVSNESNNCSIRDFSIAACQTFGIRVAAGGATDTVQGLSIRDGNLGGNGVDELTGGIYLGPGVQRAVVDNCYFEGNKRRQLWCGFPGAVVGTGYEITNNNFYPVSTWGGGGGTIGHDLIVENSLDVVAQGNAFYQKVSIDAAAPTFVGNRWVSTGLYDSGSGMAGLLTDVRGTIVHVNDLDDYTDSPVSRSPATFNPSEVPDLKAWYAADKVYNVAPGAGVPTWHDLSGNGYNLAQATGGNQPLWIPGGRNGLPVVRFDGTDDTMTGSMPNQAAPVTVIVAWKNSSAAGGVNTWFDGAGGNRCMGYMTATDWGMYSGAVTPSTADRDLLWHIHVIQFGTPGSSNYWLDGVKILSAQNSGSNGLQGPVIGQATALSDPTAGDWGEMLVVHSLLSATWINRLAGHLAAKWGTRWTPVT